MKTALVKTEAAKRELRKEPRRPAKGFAAVTRVGAGEVLGRLVDVSESGFRMAHADATLEAGQEVEFHHAEAAGRARVIWNRIMDARVETGFLVLEKRA